MMNSKNKTNQLKKASSNAKEDICISLIGPAGCGKSALLVKYLTRRFIGEYDPYYEGCWTKFENIDNTDLNIQIMDTYDEDRKNLEKYFKWSDMLILVYSITNKQSFLKIKDYLENIYELAKKSDESNEKKFLKIILLGNKIDMERHRQVSKQDIESLVRKYTRSVSTNLASKINDSTNTITNESTTQLHRQSPSRQQQQPVGLFDTMQISHFESTSCEEYDLVQNLFNKMIKDYKREKEIFSLSQPPQTMPPPAPPLQPHIFETHHNHHTNTNTNTNNESSNNKSRLNNMISSKLRDKRGKSPKSTPNMITQEINAANLSIINSNLSSSLPPLVNHSNSSSSSCSGVNQSSQMVLTTSATTGGGGSALLNNNNNNLSSGSINMTNNSQAININRINVGVDSGGGGELCESSGGGVGGGGGVTSATVSSATVKKNSSKFPFLTKILNKS